MTGESNRVWSSSVLWKICQTINTLNWEPIPCYIATVSSANIRLQPFLLPFYSEWLPFSIQNVTMKSQYPFLWRDRTQKNKIQQDRWVKMCRLKIAFFLLERHEIIDSNRWKHKEQNSLKLLLAET